MNRVPLIETHESESAFRSLERALGRSPFGKFDAGGGARVNFQRATLRHPTLEW